MSEYLYIAFIATLLEKWDLVMLSVLCCMTLSVQCVLQGTGVTVRSQPVFTGWCSNRPDSCDTKEDHI